MPRNQKATTQRAEFIDFDNGVGIEDPEIITRESVNVCPFGDGLVCQTPGCMACDTGPQCCSPGDTCILDGVENWCVAFRGSTGDFVGNVGMKPRRASANLPTFAQDPVSFWSLR